MQPDLHGGKRRLAFTPGRVAAGATVGAVLVLLAGLPLAATLNVWVDEAFTLHSTAHGIVDAWQQAIRFEIQPPLYFVIEAAWRLANESSIAFARIPSVIFVAAAVAVMVVAASRIAPRVPPLAVAACTALNAIAVWASVEMRVYPLVFLEAAVLTLCFIDGFAAPTVSRRARVLYALSAVCGLYTQYFIGFLLLGQACALLGARRHLRAYALTVAPVVLAFAPFLAVVRYHLGANHDSVERMSVVHVAHEFANTIFAYVLPHDDDWSGRLKVAGFAFAALLAVALAFWGRPRFEGPARLTAGAWLISALTFAAALAVTGGDPYFRRHLIALAPPAILLGYAVISALTRHRRALSMAAAVIFAVFTAGTLAADYRFPPAKAGDWSRVAQRIGSGPTPAVVFPAELALPLGVYRRTGPTIPLPVAMPFDPSYVDVRPLRDEGQVAGVLEHLASANGRFWVVTSGPCAAAAAGFDFDCRYLERYLERHDRLLSTSEFRGAQARLFERLAAR